MDIISRTLAETDGLNYARVESILFRNLCLLTKADMAAFLLFDQSNLHLHVKKVLPEESINIEIKEGFQISNAIFHTLQSKSIERWSSKLDFYHEILPESLSKRIRKNPVNWLHLRFSFSGSTIAFAIVHIVESLDIGLIKSFLPITALILQRSFAFSNLRKTRLELNTVYGTSSDIITLINADLKIIWTNKLGNYYFGDHIIGEKIFSVLHSGTPQRDDRILRTLFQDGSNKDFERTIKTSDGKIKNYSCMANIAGEGKSGRPNLAVIFFRDITSQKRQKNNLLLLNEKINRCTKTIVRQRTHNLLGKLYSELYDELNDGIRQTHKHLREISKILPDQQETETESLAMDEQHKLLEHMHLLKKSLHYTETLEKSFRNLVYIKQIQRPIQSYNLNQSVEELLSLIQPFRKKTVALECFWGELPILEVMPVEVNVAIYEIINNAVEALTQPELVENAKLTVETWTDDDWVYLNIRDNGPGIESQRMLEIFDIFHSSKHHVTNVGVGLSVVNEYIVNRHNGNLLMDTSVKEGASFTLSLPRKSKKISFY